MKVLESEIFGSSYKQGRQKRFNMIGINESFLLWWYKTQPQSLDDGESEKLKFEFSNFRKYATPPNEKRCIIMEKLFSCSLGFFFGVCFA